MSHLKCSISESVFTFGHKTQWKHNAWQSGGRIQKNVFNKNGSSWDEHISI